MRSDCKGVRSGEQLQGQRAGVEWQRGAPPAKMLVDDVLRSVTMPPKLSVKNCARRSGVSRQTRAPQGGRARCELRGAPRRRSGPRRRLRTRRRDCEPKLAARVAAAGARHTRSAHALAAAHAGKEVVLLVVLAEALAARDDGDRRLGSVELPVLRRPLLAREGEHAWLDRSPFVERRHRVAAVLGLVRLQDLVLIL